LRPIASLGIEHGAILDRQDLTSGYFKSSTAIILAFTCKRVLTCEGWVNCTRGR